MTYSVWLGDVLLATAATREAAIKAAIREYEQQSGGYGEYPLFPDRDALLAALLVEVKTEQDRNRG